MARADTTFHGGPDSIDWSPQIGDPSFWGWLTVFAYFGVAFLCWKARQQLKTANQGPSVSARWSFDSSLESKLGASNVDQDQKVAESKRSWLVQNPEGQKRLLERQAKLLGVLIGIFVVLGVNKQLDLQSLVTEIGRYCLHKTNWYDQRRYLQLAFVGLVALFLLGVWSNLFKLSRQQPRAIQFSLLGTTLLFGFICVRAASFHHVDMMLSLSMGGIRVNHFLELSGIVLVGISAIWTRRNLDR